MVKFAPSQAARKAWASSWECRRRSSSARKVPLTIGRAECAAHAVVGFADEVLYLVLAFYDKAYGHRLHASGRERRFESFPEHGRKLESTMRSRTRRACWASTRFMSMSRGLAMAFSMAFFVISWNTMRRVFSGFSSRTSYRCHAMASPRGPHRKRATRCRLGRRLCAVRTQAGSCRREFRRRVGSRCRRLC